MKIAIICAPGLGDAVILSIASHHLHLAGHQVTTLTSHHFGSWVENLAFTDWDTVFLQHDNSTKSKEIQQSAKTVYTFYGSHKLSKHGPLKAGFDYVCDPNQTMVENLKKALYTLFDIQASSDNGFRAPSGLIHRKHLKRVVIHTTSSHPNKNWPEKKFHRVASWLFSEGFEPVFLPFFSTLEELTSFIYESGYFLGNDSGPGHLASCLNIPSLIIAKDKKQMRLWRPGWKLTEVITPPMWLSSLRVFRENRWKTLISTKSIINKLKSSTLRN